MGFFDSKPVESEPVPTNYETLVGHRIVESGSFPRKSFTAVFTYKAKDGLIYERTFDGENWKLVAN